jgi:alkylation response protein AidB-like acyl-CoA dehydrogenase
MFTERAELLFLRENIAPQAQELDRSSNDLKLALQQLGDRAMLALTVPRKLAGGGWDELDYRRFQIAIAWWRLNHYH